MRINKTVNITRFVVISFRLDRIGETSPVVTRRAEFVDLVLFYYELRTLNYELSLKED